MSWGISFVGKPMNVSTAIKAESGKLEGVSKIEYDKAVPHLAALVEQNFAKPGSGYAEPTIKLTASGSGYTVDGEMLQGTVYVLLETSYTTVV